MIIGNIPEKIVYIYSVTSKISRGFDDMEQKIESLVIPVFISDASNAKTIQTGIRWAQPSAYEYIFNETTKRYDHVARAVMPEVIQDVRENKPFTNIKIVSLEHRGNGGRAYKCTNEDNFWFDLREDVLLDLLIEEGISKGGYLNGSYIWARVASQMKLVRVGSELHTKLIESTKRTVLKNISTKDLKIGGIYKTKTNTIGIYLGFVHTLEVDRTRERSLSSYSRWGSSYDYFYTAKTISRKHLFLENSFNDKELKDLANVESRVAKIISNDYRYCSFKSSISYVEEIGVIKLPENYLTLLRESEILKVKESINKSKNEIKYYSQSHISLCSISFSTEPVVLDPLFEDFWKDCKGQDIKAYNAKLKQI